jgi:hypothetical protein
MPAGREQSNHPRRPVGEAMRVGECTEGVGVAGEGRLLDHPSVFDNDAAKAQ